MTTPPWHHICQLTLITSIEVNLPSPYWRLLVIHAECQVLFVARFVFKSSQTCYAASHVLSVQLCLACVFDTVWAGRCSRSHAVPFANSSTRPGNELEPPPRHLRLTAFMSGFDISLRLRSSCTTFLMFDGRGCGLNLVVVGLCYYGLNWRLLHIWWRRAAELVWTGADYTAQLSDLVERTPRAMWYKLHIY